MRNRARSLALPLAVCGLLVALAAGVLLFRAEAQPDRALAQAPAAPPRQCDPDNTLQFPCVFLPGVFRSHSLLPGVPVLYKPVNPDGLGSYTVDWDPSPRAQTYFLEESKFPGFAGALQLYAGSNTSFPVTGRGAARYSYRVKARNTEGDSAWSAVQYTDVLWELEPNDYFEANGPIVSGLTYYGAFPLNDPDVKDYFYFDLATSRTVELWLTNISPGNNYQLVLRDQNQTIVAQSINGGNQDEHILTNALPAARYFIQVFDTQEGPGSAAPYHLRGVFAP